MTDTTREALERELRWPTTKCSCGLNHVCERCRAIRAALRSTEEREVVGWRPIETAPRDATRVLVLTPGSRLQVREAWWRVPYEAAPLKHGWWCYHGDKTLLCTHAHETDKGATHWMPLPDPPSTEGET